MKPQPQEQIRKKPLPLEFPGIHYIDEQELEAVTRVIRSRSLFRYYGVDLQKEAESFEAEFAAFLGVKHAVAAGSGTGALSVALSALGVGPGQEIIVPAYLWVSVAAAVVNQGAIPVLADIDDTFGLDPAYVERRITKHTAGIIMTHMSGAPGDVAAVQSVARAKGLFLLEDCAQCAGGSVHGRKVGTFGDMAIFSFQMNKNITAGEGGCVVTGDDRLFARAFACHDLGYARDDNGRLIFDDPDLRLWGRGTRLDELRAAVSGSNCASCRPSRPPCAPASIASGRLWLASRRFNSGAWRTRRAIRARSSSQPTPIMKRRGASTGRSGPKGS